VPATANIAAGGTTATVPVTGVAAGSATIHASSLPNIPDTTASVTVSAGAGPGTITLTNGTVGQKLEISTTLTLSVPAGSGPACLPQPQPCLSITLTSSDPSKLLIAGHATDAGAASLVVPVSQGTTQLTGIYVQALVSSGTANIVATATGYTSGTATFTLAPSGVVLIGPNGIGSLSASISQGLTASMTVSAAQLDSSLNFVQMGQLRGSQSISVTVSSSNTSVGTISGSPVTLNGGDTTGAVTFHAALSGSTTVTAAPPSGFSTPAGGFNTVTFSVTPAGLVAPTGVIVGNLLETTAQIALNGVAPGGGLLVTLTTADASKLLLSSTGTDAGSASITLTVQAGQSHTQQFFIYGIGSSGTATFTASAPGFGSVPVTVTLAPSGSVIAGPSGIGVNFLTATNSASSTITVFSAMLDAGLNFVAVQAMAGGSSMTVNVSSSNTSVGTVTASTVTVTGGNFSAATQFQPAAAGATSLSASASGFSTPAQGAALTVTVVVPAFSLTDGITVGKGGEELGTVVIGQLAPAGGVTVTLTSNNASQLLLSATAAAAGSTSITVTIPAGSNNTSFFIQVTGSLGNVTYTASAPGFANKTASITQVPSGTVIFSPAGLSFFSTTVAGGPAAFQVANAQLNPADNSFVAIEQVAGGSSVSATLNSSTAGVASVASPVTIPGGSASATATVTPLSAGSTDISVVGSTATTKNNVPVTVNP
jgi:hypothetical protein